MKQFSYLILLILPYSLFAQVSVNVPFPTADEEITITYDATQGTSGLIGASSLIVHTGALVDGPNDTSWENVVGTWGDPNAPGKMTKVGTDLWEISFVIRDFYAAAGLGANERVYRLGMVFREAGPCGGFNGVSSPCGEGKTSSNGDFFIDIYETGLSINFSNPSTNNTFADAGEVVPVKVNVSESSEIKLFINDQLVKTNIDSTVLSYNFNETTPGLYTLKATADNGQVQGETLTTILVRSATVSEALPVGIGEGINYTATPSQAILNVLAPGKSSVYVLGDFNNWIASPDYQMKQDGENFWLEINNLEGGKEYAFQYLVDEKYYIADPYADKILDKDDKWIPANSYPQLMEFPAAADRPTWYGSRVSVLQTAQIPYEWKVKDFQPPAKEDLVIYELLIRDFFEPGEQNYQNLIDTLGYFKRLGINAIELMPIMEFNGNESWGYNPTFMFAPDKFYGTKNKLKEFIDEAHANGIAVIMDIAMNHQDQPSPFVVMYWDEQLNKPSVDNPWFNPDAKHPFNVFFDFNHESTYTQAYLDTVNHYWLNEYNIDGFRYDLSKGFTQKFSTGVSSWSAYDLSRVNLLKRMSDKIREYDQDAYLILEHFGENTEETELSSYGFLIWGNMNHTASQNLMGWPESSSFAWGAYTTRGWTASNLVAYPESHDEERNMYKALTWGNNASGYDVKNTNTALQRSKALAAVLYSIPGPKMLWQFGEFGYDISIEDGGRLSIKPTKWEYLDDVNRLSAFNRISEIIKLKQSYPIFKTTDFTVSDQNDLTHQIVLKANPFTSSPSNSDQMSIVTIANMDVTNKIISIDFPHTGEWYDYFTGTVISVSTLPHGLVLKPGEYHIFTNYKDVVLSTEEKNIPDFQLGLYPNPAKNSLYLSGLELQSETTVQIYNLRGQLIQENIIKPDQTTINLTGITNGMYLLRLPESGLQSKFIINN